MNYLDIIIIILLIIFAISGLRDGLIREAFSLAAFVVGIYGAMYFSDFTAQTLVKFIHVSADTLGIIAFILTFIVLSVVINLLGKLISKIVEAIQLGFIDKMGGFVFGIAKGALMLSLLILVLNFFGLNDGIKEKTKKESLLYTKIEIIANYLYDNHGVVKKAMDNAFKASTDFIDETIDKGKELID